MRRRLMYIEPKSRKPASGAAVVRRVTQVKLGHMIYDADKAFVPQRNRGSGANYTETQTGEPYWIAPCRKDGRDSLEPLVVQIDAEVREEYWQGVRGMPENALQVSYESPGRADAAAPRT
jgi:hypothetical protein